MKYFILILSSPFLLATAPADLEFFEKEVRPVLAEHCYACHGAEKQKSGLRLDHISFVLKGGETAPALEPGEVEKSRLVEAIRYGDADFQMPPDGKLPAEAIAALERWVGLGAPWPDEPAPEASGPPEQFDVAARKAGHWAWQPIRASSPPATGAGWAAGEIDRFIAAGLQAEGLQPAPPADKHTLLRRAWFDLVGLPPTVEEIEAFVSDTAPDAFAKVVDGLLASPHFGERWGRHWLDLTRYSETYGHEQDYPIQHAWRYRDYVIRALNADLPYDQFVTEHVAGDLLAEPRVNEEGINESILATGFWYMHQSTHAPVDVRQDEADHIENQIDVLSKTVLGMTVSCARCHDHKFDAISTRDYYALAGFMRSSRQQIAYLDPRGTISRTIPRLQAVHAAAGAAVEEALTQLSGADLAEIGKYLLASREVMHGAKVAGDELASEQVYAEFDDFGQWTAEGEAFAIGQDSTSGAAQFEGARGGGFARSNAGGEGVKGVLRSPDFTVNSNFIGFLIAGGAHGGQTCVQLVVDDKVARTASGQQDFTLRPVRWDVGEFRGKIARLELVDQHDGDIGFIAADYVFFTDYQLPGPLQRPIPAVAGERGLEEWKLQAWVRRLSEPLDSNAPFGPWQQAMATGVLEAPAAAPVETDAVLETFDGDLSDWFVSGQAWPAAASGAKIVRVNYGQAELVPAGVMHSGLASNKLAGTLRSPTFTLDHDAIHLRIAGRGVRVRLVVHNYGLREFNGLLFEDTMIDVNTEGRYTWVTMGGNVAKYKGKRVYLEFIDDGDGYLAVDEVRLGNGGAPEAGWAEEKLGGHGEEANREIGAPGDGGEEANREIGAPGDGGEEANREIGAPGKVTEEANQEIGAPLALAYVEWATGAVQRWLGGAADAQDTHLISWLTERGLMPKGPALQAQAEALAAVEQETPYPVRAMTIAEGTAEDEVVFIRGNHKTPGEVAPRQFLEALAGAEQPPIQQGSGRLELARRMLDPGNPLPARVMANRVWHHLFGRGIVPSVDNFGVLGEAPTHPELLDYLAAGFRDGGWSVKGLIREMMLSSAYQMSSSPVNADAELRDPANRLFHRMNMRRLEGEAIRDAILASAGRLDSRMHGPSVPIYLSDFMGFSRRPAVSGPLDGRLRRTIYVEVRRNFLSPMLLAFDMPLPDTTIGRRSVSNVPAQALTLMNDPFVVEQARAWGKKLVRLGLTPEARVERMFVTTLGRPPAPEEVAGMLAFVAEQRARYAAEGPGANVEMMVWGDACHILFTLKEFTFVG